MSKLESKKICKDAYCVQEKNGRFYIFHYYTDPVFPSGHSSSRKAWKDFLKMLKSDSFTLKDVKYVGSLWTKDIHVTNRD